MSGRLQRRHDKWEKRRSDSTECKLFLRCLIGAWGRPSLWAEPNRPAPCGCNHLHDLSIHQVLRLLTSIQECIENMLGGGRLKLSLRKTWKKYIPFFRTGSTPPYHEYHQLAEASFYLLHREQKRKREVRKVGRTVCDGRGWKQMRRQQKSVGLLQYLLSTSINACLPCKL